MLLFLSMHQQRVLGYSPLRTGLGLPPMTVVMAGGAILSKALLQRFGARPLITAGGITMSAGLVWLATFTVEDNYVLHILGPTLVWAAGASIVTMPTIVLATAANEPHLAGLSSGLVNTARQVGGAIGLAALTTIATAVATSSDRSREVDDLVRGYSSALLAAAGSADPPHQGRSIVARLRRVFARRDTDVDAGP